MKQDKSIERYASATRSHFRFWHTLAIRWSDIDSMGHVNNATYFTYFEAARIEFFRQHYPASFSLEGRQGPVVASAGCNYRRELRYPAQIAIGLAVSRIGRRSFGFDYGIFLGESDMLFADGNSVSVWADLDAGGAIPLPAELRNTLERYLTPATTTR